MDKRIFVTVKQACEILGMQKSRFYALKKTDPDFPTLYKEGRFTRMLKDDCNAYRKVLNNRILSCGF